MILITDEKVINFDNVIEIVIQKNYTEKEGYILRAYDNSGEESFILGEYKKEEDAQIELSKFINSYKENKRIHRFEGD